MRFYALCLCMESFFNAKPRQDKKEKAMKKKSIKLFSFLLAMLILTSCAQDTNSQTSEAGGGNVENLVIGMTGENNIFNMQTQKDSFGRLNYNGLTQGNFIYIDENKKLQPYFFRSFEISEDGKQLVFTFPETAVWHDGKPVTQEDILFTFDYMKNVKKVGSLNNLVSWEITGENECTLTFSEPDAFYWLNTSALNTACVYPKHIWEGVENYEEYAEENAAVGCGPYKLVSVDREAQTAVYEAVPENSFLGDLTVDKVTVQCYSGEDTLMLAMINGEIDAMYAYANPIDATIMETVFSNPDIDPGESDYAGHYQITYGMERKPAEDIHFRKAIRLALDYDKLSTVINGGYGTAPGAGIIAPSCNGFDSTIPILYTDVDEANKILDDAGYRDVDGDGFREYPDGSPMDVVVTPQFSKSQDLLNRIADTVMASMKEVGVKTHIDEDSLRNSEVWEQNIIDGKYDIAIGYTTSGMANYSSAFRYFLADPRFEGEKTWIWGTYHDDEFKDTFFKMQQAINNEIYVENVKKLQKMAEEVAFAQALCWEKAFFPYRTDKYEGWINMASWGAIHPKTWYTLKTK